MTETNTLNSAAKLQRVLSITGEQRASVIRKLTEIIDRNYRISSYTEQGFIWDTYTFVDGSAFKIKLQPGDNS